MIAAILAYLDYYPNFLRVVPAGWWETLAVLGLWKTLVSLRIYQQSGMRCYVWGAVAGGLAVLGLATAPLGRTLLPVVTFSGPLLVAAFFIASVTDARSWFSDQASDKYRIIRHPSLPLQLWGKLPADFHRTPSAPATRRQGLLVSGLTLVFMGFAYASARRAFASGGFPPAAMALITMTVGMSMFHAVMMGIFAALYGARARAQASPTSTE